jgi:hypothetical protein
VFTGFFCPYDVRCSGPIRKAVLLLFDYCAFRTLLCNILNVVMSIEKTDETNIWSYEPKKSVIGSGACK